MKTILTIVMAIAFMAIFFFCEFSMLLTFVAIAIFGLTGKLLSERYFNDEDERV